MLKEEFERIAKRTVTQEQYNMIEGLYYESNLNKEEFVKSIKTLLKSIPEESKHTVLTMGVHNMYGDMVTPNGAYYMTVKVELIDVNIKTGKKIVKVIPDTFEMTYHIDLTDWDRNLEIIH